MHDGPAAFSFELAGAFSVGDAVELEQAWRTASSTIGDRILVVDLSFVSQIDEAGRDLLRRWHEQGARLVANSPTARLLSESIIGAPLPAAEPAPAPTYAPFFAQLTRRSTTFLIAILLTLLHPATALALVEVRAGEFLGDLAENGILRDSKAGAELDRPEFASLWFQGGGIREIALERHARFGVTCDLDGGLGAG